MHGDQKVVCSGLACGQHGPHYDAMRCVIVGGDHYVGIGAQQARDCRRDLIGPHCLLIDKHLIDIVYRQRQRLVLGHLLRASLRQVDPQRVETLHGQGGQHEGR